MQFFPSPAECWQLARNQTIVHCSIYLWLLFFIKWQIWHPSILKAWNTDWTLLHNQHVAVVAHILWTVNTIEHSWLSVHHHCHNFLWGTSLIVCVCLTMRSLSLNPIANPSDSLGTLNWPIFIIGFMWMKFANLSKCFLLWTPLAHFVQQKSDIFYTLPLWGGECRHDIFLFNCPSSGSLYSSLWLCHWRDSFLFRAVGTVVSDEL